MNDGLSEQEHTGIKRVLATETKVHGALIFGSRAMGTHRPSSDLDLALVGDELRLQDLARIQSKLSAMNLTVDVDLIIHASIENPALKQHIQTFGREWYRQDLGRNN